MDCLLRDIFKTGRWKLQLQKNLIKLNTANIKYSAHTYMNNNACINLREGAGKQGPLRRKLLMSQAEARNKTIYCRISQQKRRCISCKRSMRKTAQQIINWSLPLINKPDATWWAAVQRVHKTLNTPWNFVYANQCGSFSVKELDDIKAFYWPEEVKNYILLGRVKIETYL